MNIPTQNNASLIIRLIRDCLINWKLVNGLNALGVMADDYHLYLGDTIFELMGFKGSRKSDMIYENVFLANCRKVRYISLSGTREELDKLSEEIYGELLLAKGMLEKGG